MNETTFGDTLLDLSTSRAFVYCIRFADGYYYYGKRDIDRSGKWKTYKSSSNYVKERLQRIPATFTILSAWPNSDFAFAAEAEVIVRTWGDYYSLNYGLSNRAKQLGKLESHIRVGIVKGGR